MNEKTEKASRKKLRDARDRGEVAHSKDGSKAVLLVVFLLWALCVGEYFVSQMKQMIVWVGLHANQPFEMVLGAFIQDALQTAVESCAALLLSVVTLCGLVEFLIVGPVFSFEVIQPKLKNLDPLSKIQQWFASKNLIDLIKSLIKIAAIVGLTAHLLRDAMNGLVHAIDGGVGATTMALRDLFLGLVGFSALFFLVVAVADIFLQRLLFNRSQMMTKDETKREDKEMMGDPEIRQERKRIHGEIISGDMEYAVKQSSAVVVNPTHVAIGLTYSGGANPIPMITVMGREARARLILYIALREGIPVLRDVDLAWALLRRGKVRQFVPRDLAGDVEAILTSLRALKQGDDA